MMHKMEKLPEVEEARALFDESRGWSVVRWLAEKRRARTMADRATAAIDAFERNVKTGWSRELAAAYVELAEPSADGDDPFAAAEREYMRLHAAAVPEHLRALVLRVKQADDEAYRMRMRAEETFAEAERRLSVALSRRGAVEAVQSYDLYYKAIEEAEAARRASTEEREPRR